MKQMLLKELLDDSLTKTDITTAFKEIIKLVKGIKEKNINDLDKMSKALNEATKNAQNGVSSDFNSLKGELTKLVNRAISGANDTLENKINELDIRIMDIKNGRDGIDGKSSDDKKIIKKLKKEIKLLAKSMPVKEKELSIKDIDGLKEALEKIGNKKVYIGGGSTGGKTVKYHDLSASLDGVTKKFTLPVFWRIISIHLSSFPGILRDTVDYNADASNSTIEFTSEISADTILSSGQTCVIVYAEN